MPFWVVVAVVLALMLGAGWLLDRRRPGVITRRSGTIGSAIDRGHTTRGYSESAALRPRIDQLPPPGGPSGPTP